MQHYDQNSRFTTKKWRGFIPPRPIQGKTMAAGAQHLSLTNLWYSPMWLINKARATMGSIDFDPASDEFGNQRIRADTFWSVNALDREWPTVKTVFINPPGGKIGLESQAALFWYKTTKEWAAGKFEQAIFIGFSVQVLQTGQCMAAAPPQAFPFCVPRTRVEYDTQLGTNNNPAHASMICYIPPANDTDAAVQRFKDNFSDVGYVRT